MKKSPKYAVELHANETVYKSSGSTLVEAIQALKVPIGFANVPKFKTKGVFKVKKGKLTAERQLPVFPLRRIFTRPLNTVIFAKRLESLLSE